MEENSPAIAMSYLRNLAYDESVMETCVDITALELVTNKRRLFKPVKTELPCLCITSQERNCTCSSSKMEVSAMTVAKDDNIEDGEANMSRMLANKGNLQISTDARNGKTGIDDSKDNVKIAKPNAKESNIGTRQIIRKSYSRDPNMKAEILEDLISIVENENKGNEESKRKLTPPLIEVTQKPKIFVLDMAPRWGFTSIRGRRTEMEDAIAALPSFVEVPAQMLIDLPATVATSKTYTVSLFGVYDGHGGFQVANYCRDRLHLALEDEINVVKKYINKGTMKSDQKESWEEAFLNCFHKVDDEIRGACRGNPSTGKGRPPPVAPEAVGSTAVVAIVCPTHIIVANCGDSRAVLYRGKLPVPLSTDHKPTREDECARIEGSGGKVIDWDGYRVSGVLGVSRSIGDRYLRPYVIPEPEITFISRAKEDDCLILASDGLWDVLTNEEVCDVARRRILLWHKKNSVTASKEGADPAAQDAADYLARLALQRGSKDNISVIVVDLKGQRKFKMKS